MGSRKKVTKDGLTESVLECFRWDFLLGGMPNPEAPEAWALWKEYRTEIYDYFVTQQRGHGICPERPGYRPYHFWRELELAGHRRKRIGTASFDGPVQDGKSSKDKFPVFEPDAVFLRRLGLPLVPWEEKAIEKVDPIERLVSVEDAAESQGVTQKTIRTWVKEGYILPVQRGPDKEIQIPVRALHALGNECSSCT